MFQATSVSCIGIFLYQFIRSFQGPVHHTLRSNLKEWVSKSLVNDMFDLTWHRHFDNLTSSWSQKVLVKTYHSIIVEVVAVVIKRVENRL